MNCCFCNKQKLLFKCKCNNDYCLKHLLPEIHDCKNMLYFKQISWDKNKIDLEKNKVESIKLDKI